MQAQNLQVKFLVIFKSGELLLFVVFFLFNLMSDPLRIDFCVVLFEHLSVFWSYACVLFDFALSMVPDKKPNSVFTATRNLISLLNDSH
jgi:hypothetical protein